MNVAPDMYLPILICSLFSLNLEAFSSITTSLVLKTMMAKVLAVNSK